MRDLPYPHVVVSLERLGCVKLRESDWYVTLVRGAVLVQHVPKTPMVPVEIQRRIIRAFGFSDAEYVRAVHAP